MTRAEPHRRTRGRVNDGVLEQDPPDLQRTLLVAQSLGGPVGPHGEPMPGRVGDGPELVRQGLGESRQIDGLSLQTEASRVETGQVEKLGRELRQSLDLLPHRAHELGSGLRVEVLFGHQLEEAAE